MQNGNKQRQANQRPSNQGPAHTSEMRPVNYTEIKRNPAKNAEHGTERRNNFANTNNSVVRRTQRPVSVYHKKPKLFTLQNAVKAVRVSMNTGTSDTKLKTVKAKKRSPFPITALIMTLIVTGLFMFMIMSYVQINEYTLEVSNLRTDLSELQAERKELTYELDEKNDMLKIEEYATENLHMVKLDQLTKKHITIDREDKIEVVETEPTRDDTVVTTMMSSFFSNFNGLLEYLK